MSDFVCKKCGGMLIHEDYNLDETGHYEILTCSNCERDYHAYEDGSIWMRDDSGFFQEVTK